MLKGKMRGSRNSSSNKIRLVRRQLFFLCLLVNTYINLNLSKHFNVKQLINFASSGNFSTRANARPPLYSHEQRKFLSQGKTGFPNESTKSKIKIDSTYYHLIDLSKREIKPDAPSDKPRRIFDAFQYNNEAEMLYIRLWRTYNEVDYFIITTTNVTFTGFPKVITFKPFEDEIAQFRDKIYVSLVDGDFCNKQNQKTVVWCRENSQRDTGIDAVRTLDPTINDIVLASDVDEIFTIDALIDLRKNPPEKHFAARGQMFFPNYQHISEQWNNAIVFRYSANMRNFSECRDNAYIGRAHVYGSYTMVTHCSYCFSTMEEYLMKLKSYSHQEYNRPPYNTTDWIFKSHYCRTKLNSPAGIDINQDLDEIVPYDPRLRFLYDMSFQYNISQTSYQAKDLDTMCTGNLRRK